ncbi:MAG: peroxiredoxin-like family protein [Verrucomicrobiota bacterium]
MNKIYLATTLTISLTMSAIAESTPLSEELNAYKTQMRSKAPAEALETMAEGVQSIVESELAEAAIRKGNTAPEFTLTDATGKEVTLSELYADGPVVLTWYRGGWCPYCNIQLRAYQQILPEIEAAGAKLVALTPELPDESLSTAEKNELKFTVLSDVGNMVAKDYGLLFELSDELVALYKDFGIDLAKSNGPEAKSNELPLAATYIIGKDGKVAWHFVEADYTKRAEPATIVEELKKIQ